ncbi:hypothetical protein HAX54_028832 [Datura stramonium]|uniref:Uncharacterized protein n=1 Tax=Datura stramonium TaxID=4076 RepID=A0ABS8S9W4_DATST|nr:hypothetical protein [Datura stramonium]
MSKISRVIKLGDISIPIAKTDDKKADGRTSSDLANLTNYIDGQMRGFSLQRDYGDGRCSVVINLGCNRWNHRTDTMDAAAGPLATGPSWRTSLRRSGTAAADDARQKISLS